MKNSDSGVLVVVFGPTTYKPRKRIAACFQYDLLALKTCLDGQSRSVEGTDSKQPARRLEAHGVHILSA